MGREKSQSHIFIAGFENCEYLRIFANLSHLFGQVKSALGKISFYHDADRKLFWGEQKSLPACHFTQSGVFSCCVRGNHLKVVYIQNAPLKRGAVICRQTFVWQSCALGIGFIKPRWKGGDLGQEWKIHKMARLLFKGVIWWTFSCCAPT